MNPSNVKNLYESPEGISEKIIKKISKDNGEPEWMLDLRLKAYKKFLEMPMPNWGPDLSGLNLNKIKYYIKPDSPSNVDDWEKLPSEIKEIYDKLGIPEAEKHALAGSGAQFESTAIYHKLSRKWEDLGVIFTDMSIALRKYENIVKKYFSKSISLFDHKFIALHYAVWSGGTFLYVPKNVKVPLPIQSYFRMNSMKMGQFEHTIIVAEEGSDVEYIEGCSAPQYNENSLHAGAVEIFVKKGARMRYSSVQNWSKNTYNLNTKRAIVDENARIEWVGGNRGSGATMLYPTSILRGNYSSSESISVAFASNFQHQDIGSKVIIIGNNCSAIIKSKSISMDGGISNYRGLVKVSSNAKNALVNVECDALMMDNKSQSNTFPYMDINNNTATISHEARVGKISDEILFYITSRGISEEQAIEMIVSGFIEPITKHLPLDYAAEMNKLIAMEMEGSLG